MNIFNFLSGGKTGKMESCNIQVPNIPKLCDSNNYWHWRVLLRAYLDAVGLWSGNAPVECPRSKFILLSTLELWLITEDYEHRGTVSIYNDLENLYGMR